MDKKPPVHAEIILSDRLTPAATSVNGTLPTSARLVDVCRYVRNQKGQSQNAVRNITAE
jgi:hypothetical protein